jgi:hypothetical protein
MTRHTHYRFNTRGIAKLFAGSTNGCAATLSRAYSEKQVWDISGMQNESD